MIDRTAALASAALSRSGLPALGSRYSGRRNGPTASSRIMTGTLIKNTAPHQKHSRIAPPSNGPIAPPREKAMIQMLMAVVRSRVEEHVADEREGGRRDGRPGNAQH